MDNISQQTVSIIIVNYNSTDYLRQCLTALAKQKVKPEEVLVVDNFSTEDTLDGFEEEFPWVDFFFLPENIGFAAANNYAIAKSHGDWIGLVNPDAFVAPDWLLKIKQAIVENPTYGSFGSRLIKHYTPDILDGTGDVYHISGIAWRRDEGVKGMDHRMQNSEIFSPCAAAALYLRSALLEIDSFDESYFCYFEDVDLGFRLQLAGYQSLYVADAKVFHVGSGTTERGSDFSVYYGHRNLVWAFFKDMPFGLLLLLLPFHIGLNIASIFLFLKRGQAKVIMRAKFDAIKALPKVISKRETVVRKISSLELLKKMNRLFWDFRHRSNAGS